MVDKVLTANRLTDGIAVWLSEAGEWATKLNGARVSRDANTDGELEAIGKAAYAANLVVDVNLIEVKETEGVLWPLRLRERIRAEGPTMEYAPGFPVADPKFIDV